MAIFKCKMCGAPIEATIGTTVAECEYCGIQQTLPKVDDERLVNLHGRANHFRRNSEYDKAMGIYEQILSEDSTDAEAYWSLVLCRYGIEYVEDPATHKRVPTINRAQFTAIYDDDNYKAALQYADIYQKEVYEKEAKVINEIQKGILEISQKEEPFDVFICYKESDEMGSRTHDSVLANDLYHQLTQEGFKVFFARITLEDKLGSAYEPYIFAALNSAKVMVVLGTKPEYFNAIWVKNEWSRFLGLIKQGKNKILIPAYRDMDAYDLPDEFSHLQAQDMAKLGFMQDLIRGIKKITQADEPKVVTVKETVSTTNSNVAPLLERAFMFLEDGKWQEADEYCEKVLDQEPKNAKAYLGKLMAELHVKTKEHLKDVPKPFDGLDNYQKVVRFADESLETELEGYIHFIVDRNLNAYYNNCLNEMGSAQSEEDYKIIADKFNKIAEFKDAKELAVKCFGLAEEARLTFLYEVAATELGKAVTHEAYKDVATKLLEIIHFKDAKDLANQCLVKLLKNNREKLATLEELKGKISLLEEEFSGIEVKIGELELQIEKLEDEKANLTFLAGKRKKEIESNVWDMHFEIRKLKERKFELLQKTKGNANVEKLNEQIAIIEVESKELSEKLEELARD